MKSARFLRTRVDFASALNHSNNSTSKAVIRAEIIGGREGSTPACGRVK